MKKTNTKAFSDLLGGLLFLALGIWAYLKTNSFQLIKNAFVQPATFPRIMSAGLIIFSAFVVIQAALRVKNMKGDEYFAEETGSINILKNKGVQGGIVVIALCIAFVALFNVLGYVVCSAVVGIIIMYLIGKRDPKIMLAVGILVPLGMWIVFYKVLAVNIPMGILQPLKDLVDIL